MSANENKKTHWLLGTFIALVIILIAVLMTAVILKNVNKTSEVSTPQTLNSSGLLPPSAPSTLKPATTPTVIPEKSRNVCESPECITLAHHLHNWADPSVDPCQDFYKFSCGKYNEHTTSKGNRLEEKTWIFSQLITEYLDKNITTDSKSENVMKLYYQKCQESETGDKSELYTEKLREVYRRIKIIGRWPMVDANWKESDFNLNEMMSHMAKLGKTDFGFFQIDPYEDFALRIEIEYERLTTDHLSTKGANQFLTDFYRINSIYADRNKSTEFYDDVNDLFEKIDEMGETSDNAIRFPELQQKVQRVDFEKLIKHYLNPAREDVMWKTIRDKTMARRSGYFLDKTNNLETLLTTTPRRKLANFLIWNFLASEANEFVLEINENASNCAATAIKAFPLAALRILVRNYFDKENLEIVSELVEDIRESFTEIIQESTWLSNETKKNAIKKIKMINKTVGYPKELEVPGALDSFFETLDFTPKDPYYVLQNKVKKFQIEQKMNYLASILPIKSDIIVVKANALYSSWKNSLRIQIGIIDDPLFDSTFPSYARIASVGGIFGHEMGHGFDTYSRKRDGNGEDKDWWTPEDSREYEKRIKCLVDQYSNYDHPNLGKKLNGNVVIKEIAADMVGVRTALKTYNKVDFAYEPNIIGFEDYDTGKLFYRLFALNSCSARDKTPLNKKLSSKHPTNSFRVNGVFSNMKSFAEAFNCPVGSPMNPKKRCEFF